MNRQKLSLRLLSWLLLLAMLVGIFPVGVLASNEEMAETNAVEKKIATRSTTTEPAKDVGTNYLVESIPEVEGCFAQQGMCFPALNEDNAALMAMAGDTFEETVTATTPKATCSSNGLATTYCCECSAILKTTKLAALEHTDSDSDNICDACGVDFAGSFALINRINTLVDPIATNEYYDLTGCAFDSNAWDGIYYLVQEGSDGVTRVFDTLNQSNRLGFPATTVTVKDNAIYGAEPGMAIELIFRAAGTNEGTFNIKMNGDYYLGYGANATTGTYGEARRMTSAYNLSLRVVTETYLDRMRIYRQIEGTPHWLRLHEQDGYYFYRFNSNVSACADNTFYLYKLLTDRLHTENMYATLKEAGNYVNPSAAYDTVSYNSFLACVERCIALYEQYNGTVLTGNNLTNRDALQDSFDAAERELINLMGILKINLEGKGIRYFSANMYNYNEDNMNALVDVMTGADTAGFYFESGNNKNTTAFYSVYDGTTSEIVKEKTIRSQMYSITSGIAASDLSTATNPPFANTVVTTDFWSETPIENAKEVYTDVGVPFTYEDGYYILNSDTNAVFFEGEPTSGTNLAISERPAAYYWSGGMTHGVASQNYVESDYTTFEQSDGYVTGFQPFAKMTNRKAAAYAAEASVFEATEPVDSYLLDGVAFRSATSPVVEVSGSGTAVWGFGMKLDVDFIMTEDGRLADDANTPITFEFSGDDDVWVYIDGKLVLDIGGSHDAIQGVINFTDGSVIVRSDKYDRVRDKNTDGYGWSDSSKYDASQLSDVHSIITNQMYQKNIYTEVFNQTIEEFANDGQNHTLTIYYMDRGKGRTNSMIKFNLPQTDILTVNKDVKCATYQGGNLVEMDASESASLMSTLSTMSFEYTLTDNGTAMANQSYHLLENGIELGEYTTSAAGKFTLKHGQSAVFKGLNFTADNKYKVVETTPASTWFYVNWSYTATGDRAVTAATPTFTSGSYNENISSTVSIDGDLYGNETITFNCTNTFVDLSPQTDEIIVDYGKTMQIDVLENDPPLMFTWGYSRQLQGFADYTDSLNLITSRKNAGETTYSLSSGELSIVDSTVQFVPSKMLDTVERVYCVVKYTKGTDSFYVYEELRIIPATVMYYETDFGDGIFETESHQDFLFVDFGPDEPTDWQNPKGITVTQDSENGIIHGEIESDTTPFMPMYNPTLLNYTLREGDVVSIRIKVNVESATHYSGIQIFMATTTTGHTNYKEETSIRMTEETKHFNTDNFVTLQYPVNELLIGETLRAFRVDPFDSATNVKGTVDLDYIYIGPAANAPADDYLYFDFDNGTDDQLRYKQEQYGGVNFDEGNWVLGDAAYSTAYTIDNDAGTLVINLSSNTSYNGPYLSVTNGLTTDYPWSSNYDCGILDFDASDIDVMKVRFKITNCTKITDNATTALFVSHYTRNGEEKYYGGIGENVQYTFLEDEWITVSIKIGELFQAGDILSTVGVWFPNLESTNGGQVIVDCIYVGKEEDFNKVTVYNRSEWKTVTDDTTPDSVQDSGLTNNDNYLLLDFNEGDKTVWNYLNQATVTKDLANGVLKGKITGIDPWVGMVKGGNQLSYTFKKGDVVQVRIKTTITKPTNKQVGFQFYYSTRENPGYNSTKRIYDNYYDHITGEYEIVTLEVPEAHFGQTIADLRVDPVVSDLGTDADGTYEIDYIYIGPESRAPGNDAIFIDFNNDDLSYTRYRQDVYGGFDGDADPWSANTARNTELYEGDDVGTKAFTAVSGNIAHYIRSSTDNAKNYTLNHQPSSTDVLQVRFKLENFTNTTKTPYVAMTVYSGEKVDADGDGKDDGFEAGRMYFSTDYLNSGEYITLTVPMSASYAALEKVSTFCVFFNEMTSISATQLGKVTIDYIYLGSQENAPSQDKMVIGYDSSYENDTNYSNGSSLYVEGVGVPLLNSDYTLKPATYNAASFTFTGTGFDLLSRTGTQQGAIRVMIYKADGTYVKTVSVVNKSDKNLELYQIPVVSVNDLTHGTYQVKIFVNAAYDYGNDGNADNFGGALDRGGEFYFDAVRIYNPIDTSSTVRANNALNQAAYEAYLKIGEADQTLTEVRKLLIDAGSFTAGGTMEGVLYLDNTDKSATITNYTSYGPNNETYLAAGQAIAFKLVASGILPASIDLGAKTAKNEDANLTMSVSSSAPSDFPTKQAVTVTSSTVQYYPLSIPASAWQSASDGSKYVYVTIYNADGAGILSLTDIKYAYDAATTASAATRSVRFVVDADLLANANIQFETATDDLSFITSISAGAEMKIIYTITPATVAGYDSFYMTVVKDFAEGEAVTATYTLDDGITEVKKADGSTLAYQIAYSGINAKEMGDKFTATLHAQTEDGALYCSNPAENSIKSYLTEKLNDENAIDELKTMCVDMLNYGAAAQIRLDYDTDNPVNADLTEAQLQYATTQIPSAENNSTSTGDGAKLISSVSLQSKVLLYLNCNYTGADASTLHYIIKDAESGETLDTLDVTKTGTFRQAVYSNVGAKQMRQLLAITLYDGDSAVSQTLTWSVESYVASVREKSTSSEAEINMVNAMLTYGDSVAAYMSATGQ